MCGAGAASRNGSKLGSGMHMGHETGRCPGGARGRPVGKEVQRGVAGELRECVGADCPGRRRGQTLEGEDARPVRTGRSRDADLPPHFPRESSGSLFQLQIPRPHPPERLIQLWVGPRVASPRPGAQGLCTHSPEAGTAPALTSSRPSCSGPPGPRTAVPAPLGPPTPTSPEPWGTRRGVSWGGRCLWAPGPLSPPSPRLVTTLSVGLVSVWVSGQSERLCHPTGRTNGV